MRILAIDHGTRLAGWATVVDGIPQFYGVHRMESEYPQTINELYEMVREFIEAHSFDPFDLIALEKPMSLRNGSIAQKLIEHYAVCKLAAISYKKEIIEIAPPTIKLIVAGAGNADKQAVAESICIKYDIDLEDLCPAEVYKAGKRKGHVKSRLWDASDAVAIGLAAHEMINREKEMVTK